MSTRFHIQIITKQIYQRMQHYKFYGGDDIRKTGELHKILVFSVGRKNMLGNLNEARGC